MRIAVIGAGSWGMALAQVLATGTEHDVVLWGRDAAVLEELRRTRRNSRYLSDIVLDSGVQIETSLQRAVSPCDIAIFAVPTQAMREVAFAAAAALTSSAVLVSAAKGFEERSGATMSAVLCDVFGAAANERVAALSGPNIAIEVASGLPAASVIGGAPDAAGCVRDACTCASFRVYSTPDRVGVEYGGALKNVLAIAVGAADGMGVGDNGKAAILTRGLAELARLGVRAGANPLTFAGLAGIGDCVVTCTSRHSRNRQLGEAIARGASLADALRSIRMVVEGVSAARVALRLGAQHDVDMPITREVNAVLFDGKPVGRALADLMSRDPADELRGLGLTPI